MKKPNYVPQLLGLLDQVKKLQRQLELGHITPEECKKKIDKLQDEIDSIEVEKMK